MKEHGLQPTYTGPFSCADIGRCSMSPAPSVSQFKSIAAAQQPGLMLYDYSADEIGHWHRPLSHHQAVGQQHAPGRHQKPDLDVADSRPYNDASATAVPPWTSG